MPFRADGLECDNLLISDMLATPAWRQKKSVKTKKNNTAPLIWQLVLYCCKGSQQYMGHGDSLLSRIQHVSANKLYIEFKEIKGRHTFTHSHSHSVPHHGENHIVQIRFRAVVDFFVYKVCHIPNNRWTVETKSRYLVNRSRSLWSRLHVYTNTLGMRISITGAK